MCIRDRVIAVQSLRDIRIRQAGIGKQGRLAKQLDLLEFLIFYIDIFRPLSIQAQIHIKRIVIPYQAGKFNRFLLDVYKRQAYERAGEKAFQNIDSS